VMVTAFPLTSALLLPLLSIATSAGAQASAVPETSAQDAAGMVGAAALAEEAAQLALTGRLISRRAAQPIGGCRARGLPPLQSQPR
jgi:hypothetical protein